MASILRNKKASGHREISHFVVRIQAGVLAFVCALLGGLGLCMMTAWLLIQNGPNAGQHLELLGVYFIGYTVSWPGCIVGFFYGALIGGLVGWTTGTIYNHIVGIRFP